MPDNAMITALATQSYTPNDPLINNGKKSLEAIKFDLKNIIKLKPSFVSAIKPAMLGNKKVYRMDVTYQVSGMPSYERLYALPRNKFMITVIVAYVNKAQLATITKILQSFKFAA